MNDLIYIQRITGWNASTPGAVMSQNLPFSVLISIAALIQLHIRLGIIKVYLDKCTIIKLYSGFGLFKPVNLDFSTQLTNSFISNFAKFFLDHG